MQNACKCTTAREFHRFLLRIYSDPEKHISFAVDESASDDSRFRSDSAWPTPLNDRQLLSWTRPACGRNSVLVRCSSPAASASRIGASMSIWTRPSRSRSIVFATSLGELKISRRQPGGRPTDRSPCRGDGDSACGAYVGWICTQRAVCALSIAFRNARETIRPASVRSEEAPLLVSNVSNCAIRACRFRKNNYWKGLQEFW